MSFDIQVALNSILQCTVLSITWVSTNSHISSQSASKNKCASNSCWNQRQSSVKCRQLVPAATGNRTLSPVNGHFSRWTWISRYQNVSILDLLELRMMEVVVTNGAITRAKLQSIVSEITYTVSSGTLNSSIPYHTSSSQIVITNIPTSNWKQNCSATILHWENREVRQYWQWQHGSPRVKCGGSKAVQTTRCTVTGRAASLDSGTIWPAYA